MATRKNAKRSELRKTLQTSPSKTGKLPSLPASIPTTSKDPGQASGNNDGPPPEPCRKKFLKYVYDREQKTFCGRTCKSWLCIIVYSIMYLIFLSTYTMIFLFSSLSIIKLTVDYKNIDKVELLTYSENGVGLTATPTSEENVPLIWYRNGESQDYDKYVIALNRLLLTGRRKTDNHTYLGPCGKAPYGYGDKPCILLRINKQMKWAGKPLDPKSPKAENAPAEVKKWMKTDKNKLWLHCDGYYPYDKEHIGSIKYYPNPPGFDPDIFPMDMQSESPLVAVQISDFTLGISLAIECKLWYERGPSSLEFLLYVSPQTSLGIKM